MLQYAIRVALEAHKNQRRKGTEIPYVVHPIEVGIILGENGAAQDVIIAGMLHDTIEDTDLTLQNIRRMFGRHIAELVAGASESNRGVPGVTWEQRKQHTIDYLKTASEEVQMIACADKLSNMRSIFDDYKEIGEKLWDRFNAGYEKQKWYYTNLVESLRPLSLDGYKMYDELCDKVKSVFSR